MLPNNRPLLVLAPMAGITDAPFRLLAHRYGADLTVSEMIASVAMVRKLGKSWRMAAADPASGPRSIQIFGNDPTVMAEAAQMQVDQGAEIIDINMGCPVKKVVKGLAGAALLRDEPLVGRILAAVVQAVGPIPVTLKMRTGWDHTSRNGEQIARIAEASGVSWLAVHGRTRAQLYRGRADWEYIGRIKQAVRIPVIGNGDVRTPEEAAAMWHLAQVDGIMIGRGAMGRPWLFRQIGQYLTTGSYDPEPDLAEQYQVVVEQFERMLDLYGPESGNRMARKHLAWYARGEAGSARFRDQINRSEDARQTLEMIQRYYFDATAKSVDSTNNRDKTIQHLPC